MQGPGLSGRQSTLLIQQRYLTEQRQLSFHDVGASAFQSRQAPGKSKRDRIIKPIEDYFTRYQEAHPAQWLSYWSNAASTGEDAVYNCATLHIRRERSR